MLCAVPQATPKPQFSHSRAAPSGAAAHVCTVPPGQRLQTRSGPGAPEEGCQALPGCLLISFGALQFPFPITGPAPGAGRACRVLLAPQLPGGSRTEGGGNGRHRVQSGEVSRCSHLTDVFCRSPWSRPHGWGLSDLAEQRKLGPSVGPLLEKSS